MAFEEEEEFQQLIHKNPGIILDGIPEINPILCDNTPAIVSLGTEINIQGKLADNIFIDTNGILTIVECKLYGDSRIAREVYPQIVNYASGIKEKLKDFDFTDEDINYASGIKEKIKDNTDEDKYLDEFFNIVNNTENKNCQFETPEKLIEHFIDEEKMLKTKDKDKWKIQFKKYFKKNIEEEIFRLIIACAPRKEKINNDSNQKTGNNFDQNKIKNLIQIVNFTETKSNKYDLIIMDSRLKEKDDSNNLDDINERDMVSRIIWRNYDSLREVPLISKYKREKLSEDDFYAILEENTGEETVKRVRDYVEWFKCDTSHGRKIEESSGGFIMKYFIQINNKPESFNLGQFMKTGEFKTDRLRDNFTKQRAAKEATDITKWNYRPCDEYFSELQKLFKNSIYEPGENWGLQGGKHSKKGPKIESIEEKDIDKFYDIIDNFIKKLDKIVDNLN